MSITLTKLDSFLHEIHADEIDVVKKLKQLDLEIPKILFADDAMNLTMKSHRISKKDITLRYSIVLSSIRSAGNAGSPTNRLKLASGSLFECEIEDVQDILAVLWANRWNQEQSSDVKKV